MTEAMGLQLVGELLEPASRADPYPIYARLRALGPVRIEPMRTVVVTDIATASGCCATRGSAPSGSTAAPRPTRTSTLRTRRPRCGSGGSCPGSPGPHEAAAPGQQRLHRPHRRPDGAVHHAPGDQCLDRAGDTFDVLSDFAHPLPVMVICRMLGVPLADEPLFRRWSAQLTRLLDGFSADGGEDEEWLAGMVEMHRYVNDLVAGRRARPRSEDLISDLIAAEDGGDQLSHDELVSTVVLLLVAGHETTCNLIANGVLALLRHPGPAEQSSMSAAASTCSPEGEDSIILPSRPITDRPPEVSLRTSRGRSGPAARRRRSREASWADRRRPEAPARAVASAPAGLRVAVLDLDRTERCDSRPRRTTETRSTRHAFGSFDHLDERRVLVPAAERLGMPAAGKNTVETRSEPVQAHVERPRAAASSADAGAASSRTGRRCGLETTMAGYGAANADVCIEAPRVVAAHDQAVRARAGVTRCRRLDYPLLAVVAQGRSPVTLETMPAGRLRDRRSQCSCWSPPPRRRRLAAAGADSISGTPIGHPLPVGEQRILLQA